jgi:hypothetical protein
MWSPGLTPTRPSAQ